ncbi:hypothetical protein, partial [Methylobacterium sp. J-068]|uniref:hypothetical protein n=1 Tax=Methylobacterium sp. J-068 TaxID=2836649 RepID=UPI001FBAB0EA
MMLATGMVFTWLHTDGTVSNLTTNDEGDLTFVDKNGNAHNVGAVGPYTQITPTVDAGAGAQATATVRYQEFGKKVEISSLIVNVTKAGTGQTVIIVPMPTGAQYDACIPFQDVATGNTFNGHISAGTNTIVIQGKNGEYPAVSGSKIVGSGFYERP